MTLKYIAPKIAGKRMQITAERVIEFFRNQEILGSDALLTCDTIFFVGNGITGADLGMAIAKFSCFFLGGGIEVMGLQSLRYQIWYRYERFYLNLQS